MSKVYLRIGGTDLSGFLSENDYSVETVPVYDKENEFVNIYGETVRSRTGRKITIRARLTDVTDGVLRSINAAAAASSVTAVYSDPDEKTGVFTVESTSSSLDRVSGEVCYRTVDIILCGFVREGL